MKTPHTIDDTQTLELLEERAEVQKQRVNTGKVILSKKIHTRTVNIPITLTEEHLVITYQQDDASLATHEQLSWLILLTTQKPHTPKLPSTVRCVH